MKVGDLILHFKRRENIIVGMGIIEKITPYESLNNNEGRKDNRVHFFDLMANAPRDYFESSIVLFSKESNKSNEYIEIIEL